MRAALLVTVAAGLFAGVAFRVLPAAWLRTFNDLLQTLVAIVATACFAYAAAGFRGRRRWAWGLAGAGMLCLALGLADTSYYEVIFGRPRPPLTISDGLYLLAGPLCIAGIVLLPAPARPALLARGIVDGAIVAAVALWIVWALIGESLLARVGGGGVAAIIDMYYPAVGIVLVGAAAYASTYSSPAARPVVLMLAAALCMHTLADAVYLYRLASHTYHPGMRIDVLWVSSFVLGGGAAVVARRRPWPPPIPDARPAWADRLVYAVLLVGMAFSGWHQSATPMSGILYWVAIAIVLLLLTRQQLGAVDNRQLNRERDEALAALSASEAKVEQLVSEAPVVLFALDPQGVITVARGSAIPNFSNAVGHNIHDYTEHPVAALLEAALGGDPAVGTVAIRGHMVEIRAQPSAGGGVVGVGIDVSDRLAADEARRESAAKDRFLANMSHELRTPLNSILGFAQMLDVDSIGPLNEKQRRYQQHILASGKQLLDLINELLDLAKVTAGQLDVELTDVDLVPIVEAAVASVKPQADAADLVLALGPLPAAEVWCDGRRLRQVLLNLLANAVKFTPAGGRIVVSTGVDRRHARIDVEDSGIGIASHDQERIFEEFTQLDAGRSRGAPGTGLGLALSRALVRQMGGELTVRSAEGEGSVFSVALPLASAAAAELGHEVAEPAESLPEVGIGAGQADAHG